jgi:hypothetical protein
MHIKLTPETESPRWTLCRAALGREPACWEFTLWIDQRWRDFSRYLGAQHIPGEVASTDVFSHFWWKKRQGSEMAQQAFDDWLKGEVEAGKYQEVPR